jgi:pimeloyl-ACP methyl ester carboxylesterase
MLGLLVVALEDGAMTGLEPSVEHHSVAVDGVELHVASCGTGPLILFLHGFPQCWYEWRHQLVEFGRDHLAVAPDLRGYDTSSKPPAVDAYRISEFVEDVAGLADRLGHERFALVGHNWGGGVAWTFALTYPRRVERLVVINCPHPVVWDRELRANPAQQEALRFYSLFRSPKGEEVLSRENFAAMRRWFHGVLREEDMSVYMETWRQPGAMTGMLNLYRAADVGPPDPDHGRLEGNGNYAPHLTSFVVGVPTLVVWGETDPALLVSNLDGLEEYVPDLTVARLPGGHWLPEQHPTEVNRLIREFLAPHAEAASP